MIPHEIPRLETVAAIARELNTRLVELIFADRELTADEWREIIEMEAQEIEQ